MSLNAICLCNNQSILFMTKLPEQVIFTSFHVAAIGHNFEKKTYKLTFELDGGAVKWSKHQL